MEVETSKRLEFDHSMAPTILSDCIYVVADIVAAIDRFDKRVNVSLFVKSRLEFIRRGVGMGVINCSASKTMALDRIEIK